MKVYNLMCEEQGHSFEGWFGSEQDYQDQQQRQLLSCPLCGSLQIRRMPSAPRLNLKNAQKSAAPRLAAASPATSGASSATSVAQDVAAMAPEEFARALQAQLLQLTRSLMAGTEDVGERFAEEARKIHYQESEARGIRGVLNVEQRAELEEEGIEVLPLPLAHLVDGPLQ